MVGAKAGLGDSEGAAVQGLGLFVVGLGFQVEARLIQKSRAGAWLHSIRLVPIHHDQGMGQPARAHVPCANIMRLGGKQLVQCAQRGPEPLVSRCRGHALARDILDQAVDCNGLPIGPNQGEAKQGGLGFIKGQLVGQDLGQPFGQVPAGSRKVPKVDGLRGQKGAEVQQIRGGRAIGLDLLEGQGPGGAHGLFVAMGMAPFQQIQAMVGEQGRVVG